MKRRKTLLFFLISALFLVSLISPLETKALVISSSQIPNGNFKPIKNFNFSEYNTNYDLKYWTGEENKGRKSTVSLQGSYSWRAEGSIYIIKQLIDSSYYSLLENRRVEFSFWFRSDESEPREAYARAEIRVKYIVGGIPGISGYNPRYYRLIVEEEFYYGPWIKPDTKDKWFKAYVECRLPTDIIELEVRINLKDDYYPYTFTGYIDAASLKIMEYKYTTSSWGDAELLTSFNGWTEVQGATYDGRVFFSVGVAVKSKAGYYVKSIKIQVNLEPLETGYEWGIFPYKYTTQQGQLNVETLYQSNNRDHDIDPAAEDQTNEILIGLMASVIGKLVGTAASAKIGPAGGWVVGYVTSVGLSNVMKIFATKCNDPIAQGNRDYSVHEIWNYIKYPWVTRASAGYELEWKFKTGSDYKFKVSINVTVKWAEERIGNYGPYLVEVGSSTLSTSFTFYA